MKFKLIHYLREIVAFQSTYLIFYCGIYSANYYLYSSEKWKNEKERGWSRRNRQRHEMRENKINRALIETSKIPRQPPTSSRDLRRSISRVCIRLLFLYMLHTDFARFSFECHSRESFLRVLVRWQRLRPPAAFPRFYDSDCYFMGSLS